MQRVQMDKEVIIYMSALSHSEVFMTCENVFEAIEMCNLYAWHYVDENGFDWRLEISD